MVRKTVPGQERTLPTEGNDDSLSLPSSPHPDKKKRVTPEQRWRMIKEAAYYRAEKRGFLGDHLADDWVAAEAEIDEHYEVDLAQTMRESDVGKLIEQLVKAFSGRHVGGIDVGEILKAQRGNLEALALANQQALEGANLLLIRQAEILQRVLQDAADSINVLATSSGTADLIKKQEAILQTARERALSQMHDIAKIVADSQERALSSVRQRLQEEIDAIADRLARINRNKPS
ncbi:MAG: phasin family protein [Gammaproteobacteria bacterium]|jgi:phasin family protein